MSSRWRWGLVLKIRCFACGARMRPDEAHEYGDPLDPSPCRSYVAPVVDSAEAVAFRSVLA